MRQLYKRQTTFERGIVENWQQDSFPRDPQGVLYLENYNPNLEQKTLIKRYGENIIEYKGEKIYFNTEVYTNNVFNYPENRIVTMANELLLTSNPFYNKTFLSFLKRLPQGTSLKEKDYCIDNNLVALTPECTGIVARIYEYENNAENLDWHEPFKDGATYPGWYTCGLYTDHVRYGEQLLFTTLLDKLPYGTDLDKYLFPVYMWGLWDLTKKRKDSQIWWNGIDFPNLETDKQTYRKWKVKTPTMDLLRNDNVGYAYWDKSANAWQRKGNEKPIEILFMENDLDIANNGHCLVVTPPEYEDYGIFNREDIVHDSTTVGFFERESYLAKDIEDEHPKLVKNSSYDSPNLFFKSIEIADFDGYTDYLKNTRGHQIQKIALLGLDWKNASGNSHYPIGDKILFNDILVATEDSYKATEEENPVNFYKSWKSQSTLTHIYLRYIDNRFPRPWHKGEKIPFVLTVKIDGVETVLYKDIYTIQTQQGMIAPINTLNTYYTTSGLNTVESIDNGIVTDNLQTVLGISNLGYIVTNSFTSSPHVKRINDRPFVDYLMSNSLQFTIRIDKDFFGKLLEQDPTEFNLYISEPHKTKKWLSLVGIKSPTEIPPGYYHKPAVEDMNIDNIDFDYSKFRLVKSFLVSQESMDIDYKTYDGTATRTNAWVESDDIGTVGGTGYLYAVPDIDDGTGFIANNRIPFFDNTYLKKGFPYGNNDRMWYSDFTLWDYPKDSPPLTLNNTGKYWKGLGAKHVEIIQGRTFIAGCIDDEGKEEQAKVRYSIVQNGAISKDVFVEEDNITFGHSRITALLNYRDQLWVFNEYGQYRMLPHNIADVSTWEILDVQHAQGCLSNKLLTITPNGVAFASRNGIWMSDGRMPMSLTDNPQKGLAIQSLYQRLTLGSGYIYQEQADPGETYVDEDLNFNPYCELYYNKETDELVLSTPVKKKDNEMYTNVPNNYILEDWEYFTHEIRLIYSFAHNNWRVESYRLQTDQLFTAVTTEKHKSYSDRGRFHLSENKFLVVKELYNAPDPAQGRDSNYTYSINTFNDGDKEALYDSTFYMFGTIKNEDVYKIVGEIVTHEIGDGENDFVLRRAYLENSPRDIGDIDKGIYGYNEFIYENVKADYEVDVNPTANEDITQGYKVGDTWKNINTGFYYICLDNTQSIANWVRIYPSKDPYFEYELRNRSWLSQIDYIDYKDIVKLNMNAKGGQNPFKSLMQTPGDTNYGTSDKVVGRESLVMLFPRNTKFRRARFKILSDIIAKIRGVTIEYAMFKRRAK